MRPDRRQIRRMALAAAAAVAVACSKGADPEPRLRSVQPAQGAEGAAVAIRIDGEGLEPHVLSDYGDQGASLVDARFEAWLGTSRLRDVRPSGDGALLATVPEDLPAGLHDLAVSDPAGRRATLPAAYRVLAPSEAAVLVATFRFGPIASQVANAPFPVTVTAVDAAGQPVTGFSGTATLSDRTGALVPGAIGPFAWGVWTGPVEVRAANGADALTATDGLGHAGTSSDFAVLPAPAARVAFTSPAVDTIAGACAGPVTVALQDLYGFPTSAAAPVDVAVSGGTAAVYADPACAAPATGATLAPGAASASVYVRSTLAAPFTLDAAAAGLGAAAQPGLVRPAPASRLVFTTAPQTLVAGTCSAAAIVRAEDAFGNVSPPAADTAVTLSSTAAAGLTFHGIAGCGSAPVTAVTLPAAASTATFWFRATVAQPVTVGAAGAGIAAAAAQGETIVPAAPGSLAFVTAPQTIAAGACSGVATVEARDAFGNAAPVAAGTLVSLAVAPAAGLTFHLDPACGDAPVAATPLAAGATTASFRFRATATGVYGVTATGAGLPGAATQAETVGPAAADRLVFTSAPKAATAGQCSGPLSVEVRDGLGNAAPVAAATPVSLAASPSTGTAFFATADCSGPSGGPASVPAGSATASFSFRSTRAGTFDATATLAGLLPATQAETVRPAAPERLVFATPPQTLVAGACSAVATVEARDAYDNVAPVASLTAVALAAAPATGFQLFATAGCGTPAASVDLPAGASSTSFWFRGTAAGSVTVTATGAGIPTAATQAETIQPAAPDRLVFATAPQTVTAGVCSGAATVEAFDPFGNVAPTPAPTTVALAAAPGAGFQLFGAAGCGGAPVTSVGLAAGASAATFWFRGTVSGSVTITAAGAGIAAPATQVEAIRPAAADRLVFTAAAQTVTAGVCSSAATVEARDAFGNVAPAPALTPVALSALPAAGFQLFDAAGCGGTAVTSVDLAAGASTATFWFRGTAAGTVTVTAGGAGIATPAAQAETIRPAAPERLVFVTPSQTVTAGACSAAATVEARDAFDNVAPVAALTPVALSALPAAGFQLLDAAGCGGAPVTAVSIAAGASSTSFWFSGTAAGSVTVGAAGSGIPTPATQTETVRPGVPDRLVFTSAPQRVAAGTCSAAATLEARDVHGNAAPVAALTSVALSALPSAGFQLFDGVGCGGAPVSAVSIAAGASSATFWFRGTLAGTVTVTATGAGIPTAASQAETVDPAAPDRLVFTSGAQTATAGLCSAVATLEARDAYGNVAPVAALTAVTLAAAPPAGFQLFDASGCGGAPVTSVSIPAAGSSAAFRFRGTTAGAVAVTATGAGITGAATQTEIIDPAAPAAVVFTSPAQVLQAGSCSATARIELRDAFGNATADPGAAIALALAAAPAAGFELFEDPGCAVAVAGGGIAVAAGSVGKDFWFRGTLAGSVTLASSPAGLAGASQLETIDPAAATRIAYASAPATAVAGACSAVVTVVSQDAYGNVAPVSGATTVALSAAPATGFELHAAGGCGGAPVASTAIAAGGTTGTFRFRGTVTGTVAVTASAFGTSADQAETILPAAPDRLVFTSAAQTATAGACSAPATLEARDAYGNVAPVAALTSVALSAAPPAGLQLFDAAGCGGAAVGSVSIAAGASGAAFWFRGTAAGPVAITATGAGIPTPATQGETVIPASPVRLVFTSAAQTVTAGLCSGLATVESRDAWDNVAPVAASTQVALSAAPAAGFELFDPGGCGATPIASVTIGAGASSASFRFRGTISGAVTVTASGAGISTPATQVETIDPAAADRLVFTTAAQAVTAGSCSAAATVEARDPYGNVARVAAPTTVSLSAAPAAGFQLFDAAGCGGPAVGAVVIAAGGSSASFWFQGTAAGSVSVTAAGAGIPAAASQTETVSPAPPDRLVFTTAAQTLDAGACSATATVEVRDAYGNPSPVAALTVVALAAAPATGFEFHDASGCGGAPLGSTSIAAGATTASFRMRGTAAGAVTVTAAGGGVATPATQLQTITPGPTDHLGFDPVAPVWIRTWSYALRVVALDVFGNPTPAFGGTAALSLGVPQPPNGAGATLSCPAGCGSGTVTAPFVSGVWTGSVSVGWADADPQKLGVVLRAAGTGAWSALAGASGAFDVIGATRSPPSGRVTASPVVVFVNQPVTFDASGSSDYQTPAASLQVSWDFQGSSTAVPAYPAPAAPWTAWTTAKTATNVYSAAGTYTARVAVRDADGDAGFGSVTVFVLPAGAGLCVVTTNADVDDGATACSGGSYGADGQLSLAEALRLAPSFTTITFASPMTISGTGAYTIPLDDITIVAPAGTLLDGKSLTMAGTRARVVGLELANQASAVVVSNKKAATLEDCNLHDMPGITDYGTLTLTRVRMANCVGQCVSVTDATNADTLTVRYSTFLGGPGAVGLDIAQCKSGKLALVSQSSVFAGFATAVRIGSLCAGYTNVRHTSFASNGTGIAYATAASWNHVLRNSIFSGHTTAAVTCGLANFASRDAHLLYQNASDGCLPGDPGTLGGDPAYLFVPAGDYRVGLSSPAVDSGIDLGLSLLPQFPATAPRFLGAGPDRGGRETW